jgi:hypothetical protein
MEGHQVNRFDLFFTFVRWFIAPTNSNASTAPVIYGPLDVKETNMIQLEDGLLATYKASKSISELDVSLLNHVFSDNVLAGSSYMESAFPHHWYSYYPR